MALIYCCDSCTKPLTGQCTFCDSPDVDEVFWWHRVLVVLTQWFADMHGYMKSPAGWLAIGVIVAAYVGLYAIGEARHERQMSRALFEQNRFMTLAASGSPGGLNAALAEYQTLKTKRVSKSPNVFFLWTWFQTERVNEDALNRWTKRFFAGCPKDWCGQGLDLTVLKNGELVAADMR